MPRTVRNSCILLVVATLAVLMGREAAADIDPSQPTPSRYAVPPAAVPSHWNEEHADAQPLEYRGEHTAVNPAVPALQYPDPTADGLPAIAEAPDRYISDEPQRPLPLSRPSSDAPEAEKSRQMQPLVTGAASLGIVLGLFLLVVLVTRRGSPKGAAALPPEVVEVLGRATLVGRQHVHLVRCANKLLLVCASATGTQTLTEITDPAEVERMLDVCQGSMASGSTFRHIVGQLGHSPRNRRYAARHQASEIDFDNLEAGQHAAREARA